MTITDTPDMNSPFEEAYQDFIAVLPPKDRTRVPLCSSPEDLVKSLENLGLQSKKIRKKSLTRCLDVCKSLNDRLRPYFDSLNVIVSANVNCALTYGALRVVLELASAFPSFFDKLTTTLQNLAQRFPMYDDVVGLFDGHPPTRIRQHLEAVYHDMFKFLRIAASVFTCSSGKPRNSLGVLAKVAWKPFDLRFRDLLARMRDHTQFVITEISISQAQRSNERQRQTALEMERAELERKRSQQDREKATDLRNVTEEIKIATERAAMATITRQILVWLDPPAFADSLESIEREEGTAQWIFDHSAFQRWVACPPLPDTTVRARNMPPWVLWIHGNPGCGKTVLASSVIETIMSTARPASDMSPTCYFFFKYDDPKCLMVEQAYRSALAQIFHHGQQDTDLLDLFSFAMMSESSSGQPMATANELLDLMRICANYFGHITFIVDAIDEASEPNKVAQRLKDLATTAPVRLLCLSRPSVNTLQNQVPDARQIAVDRTTSNLDIHTYLSRHLQDMLDDGMLPSTADANILANVLVRGADGMFLWATLMLRYLRSPALTPSSRLAAIRRIRFPEGLEAMYHRILDLITSSYRPETELARRLLIWLYHTIPHGQPLDADFLRAAVREPDDTDETEDFHSVVVSVCGALVEYSQGKFHFIHLTVREYFDRQISVSSSPNVPVTRRLVDQDFAHVEIAARCIQHILSEAPKVLPAKSSREFDNSVHRDSSQKHNNLEGYAMVHWTSHLSYCTMDTFRRISDREKSSAESMALSSLLSQLSNFLRTPLAVAFWVEGLYRVSVSASWSVRDQVNSLKKWSGHVIDGSDQFSRETVEVARAMAALASELEQINETWARKLSMTPALIWDDVLVFHKGGILSKLKPDKELGMDLVTLAPNTRKDLDGNEIHSLSTISSTSADGKLTGVLTAFPGPGFQRLCRLMDSDAAYRVMEEFSSEWTVRYELWCCDTRRRLGTLDLEIPEYEIALLLRQSFREDDSTIESRQGCIDFAKPRGYDMSFPMAIGHDCRSFSILRTIYNIAQTTSEHREQSPVYTCRCALLPVEDLPLSQEKWRPDQLKIFDPKGIPGIPDFHQVAWRNWYTYSLAFSPNGKYVAFADYRTLRTQVAVFSVFGEHKLQFHLLQSITAMIGRPRVSQMTFHPHQHSLVFLAARKVWIWNFTTQSSAEMDQLPPTVGRHTATPGAPLVQISTSFDDCQKPEETYRTGDGPPLCLRHARAVNQCNIKSFAVSFCGKYIVIKTEKDVEVRAIPETAQVKREELMLDSAPTSPVFAPKKALIQSSGKSTSLERLESPGIGLRQTTSMLPDAVVISRPGGDRHAPPTALTLRIKDNDIAIGSSAPKDDELHLIALPDYINIQNSVLGLRAPSDAQGLVQITINKQMAEGYSLTKEPCKPEEQFPALVKRKLSSIVQVSGLEDSDTTRFKRVKAATAGSVPLGNLKHFLGEEEHERI